MFVVCIVVCITAVWQCEVRYTVCIDCVNDYVLPEALLNILGYLNVQTLR